jgi:hypothetical protein
MEVRGVVLGFVLGAAGAAAGFWLTGALAPEAPSPAVSASATPSADPKTAARLRADLEAERDQNIELAAEVEWLRHQLDLLTRLAEETSPEADEDAEAAEPGFAKNDGDLFFDDRELADGGVPPSEIDRIREIFEASEMDVIELMHEAQRDGTYGRRPYNLALRNLRIGLRNEIGDDDYDLLLFATGRANRVAVTDVIGGSPAARWGLEPGDLIVRYGDQRVFKPRELQTQATRGRRGDRVTIDVLRDGERVRLYGVRGPMGVKLKPARRLPQAGW